MARNFKSVAVGAILAVATAFSVQSATIDIDPQNGSSVFRDRNGDNAWHITVGRSVGSGRSLSWTNVHAGMFRLTEDLPNGIDRDFVAFCLSPGVALDLGVDYADGSTLSQSILSNLGLLARNVFDEVDDSITAGAFQLAVWELATDTDFSLSERRGNFRAWANNNADTRASLALAQGWLDAIRDGNWVEEDNMRLTFYKAQGSSQDLLAIAPVPLPAAGLLLVGAIGGLVVLRRRKA